MRRVQPPKVLVLISIIAIFIPNTSRAELADGDAFGNWRVNCEIDEQAARQGCFIVQNVVLREGGQRVLQFAIGFVEDTPDPIALLTLPLGISLPPGARIQIDEREATRIAIERCEPNGCRAGMKLNDEILGSLRAGNQISVTFYDAKRQPIEVP
ncbi:MAG: invasion associated locus B family protein, partial [Gammaproteobacteria bacterium]|nr:invasion associated locus B family protein [Gammaproteobacteria bacterium]